MTGNNKNMLHQYVDRQTGEVMTEQLFGDPIVQSLYSDLRESMPLLYRAAISKRMSKALGFLNYDISLGTTLSGNRRFMEGCGVNYDECVETTVELNTPRKVFERKIRYW